MRAARLLSLFLLIAGCDDGEREPGEPLLCVTSPDCAALADEGGMCCGHTCVDCWSDTDGDGTFDCDDPDTLDGACLAEQRPGTGGHTWFLGP